MALLLAVTAIALVLFAVNVYDRIFMQVSKWLDHSTFTLTFDTNGDWIPEA